MSTPVQPVIPYDHTGYNTFYEHQIADTTGHTAEPFGKLLEPGLRRIFFETYGEVPEQFSRVFNVMKSNKAKENEWGMGAFGDWEARASEVDEVAYDTLSPGLERTYTHKAYTKGFMITRELYEDEQYRQIAKFPKAMARAGRAFVEKTVAQQFHKAFTTGTNNEWAIYDTKALCAADHPLVDSTAVVSNKITTELSEQGIEEALSLMRACRDEAGNLITMRPNLLVIPPALEWKAKKILHSASVPGSGDNDINPINGKLEIFVWDYLGSACSGNTATDKYWFVMDTSMSEINFFWRIKPEFKWGEDFDTFVAKYRGYMRFSFGVSDWRGIVGSTGVTAATPHITEVHVNSTEEDPIYFDEVE